MVPGMASSVTAMSDVPDACFMEMPTSDSMSGTMMQPASHAHVPGRQRRAQADGGADGQLLARELGERLARVRSDLRRAGRHIRLHVVVRRGVARLLPSRRPPAGVSPAGSACAGAAERAGFIFHALRSMFTAE